MAASNDLPVPQFPSASPSTAASKVSVVAEKNGENTPHGTESAVPFAYPEPQTGDRAASKPSNLRRRRLVLAGIGLVILILVILAVVLPVYFLVVRPKNLSTVANAGGGDSGTSPPPPGAAPTPKPTPTGLITGGDGSLVTTEDGSTFIYNNSFGGYWYWDPTDPFNDSARPQQDTPPLNETWRWGVDPIHGVNLGGWLVTEPFITPALYQKYPGAIDEYTLGTLMRADAAGGGIGQMEEHYKTFITEKDFAEIAAAGLNWVRLPIPYYAIEVWDGEPYLEKVSWKYALKAFEWARKYGLRVNLDLHSAPGAQNPWWHSGRENHQNFLTGPMGVANAQRTLDYLRIITEFISQDQYKNVVVMLGIVNEPVLELPEMERFYYQAHQTIRSVTGYGAGHGPFIAFVAGFGGIEGWANFLRGSDRLALENHPYFAFGGSTTAPLASFVARPCQEWAAGVNTSMSTFGLTTAGEWTLAFNDCGLYIHGVDGPAPDPVSCAQWERWETWTPEIKDNLRQFALNQISALQNHFFWTWKISPAADGLLHAPLWSYKLGLDNGWVPKNPREAAGACPSTAPFSASPFQPWQIGGAGAGTITSPVTAYTNWPPATAQYLYAPNRPVPKLPGASYPLAGPGVDLGDSWTNDADTALSMGPNPGCAYPNSWGEGGGPPTAACRPV